MKSILLLSCAALVAAVMCGSASASAAEAGIGPSFKGRIGLQLYSLRDQFPKDVPGTLDEVKGWGIKYAEVAGTYGLSAREFTKQLAARASSPSALISIMAVTRTTRKESRAKPKNWVCSTPALPGFRTRATSMKRHAVRPPQYSTRPARSWRRMD